MNRTYDLFEVMPDSTPIWRGNVTGLQNASAELEELAEQTENECFAMHLASREIVLRLNVSKKDSDTDSR